jgi:hypothetical protein
MYLMRLPRVALQAFSRSEKAHFVTGYAPSFNTRYLIWIFPSKPFDQASLFKAHRMSASDTVGFHLVCKNRVQKSHIIQIEKLSLLPINRFGHVRSQGHRLAIRVDSKMPKWH